MPAIHGPGKALRLLRQKKNMTQGTLASRAGVSRRTIIRTESGETIPKFRTVLKIIDALGFSGEELQSLVEEYDIQAWPIRRIGDFAYAIDCLGKTTRMVDRWAIVFLKAAGECIKQRRKARGLTQEELARHVGLPKGDLYYIERGEERGNWLQKVEKVCSELGIDVKELADATNI